MGTLEALLAGIVSDPLEETRWLVLADWLEENDDPRRAELLRLHRQLIATCCEPDAHPERSAWQARMVELLIEGVKPCVPQKTLDFPGGVPLVLSFIPPGSFLMGGTIDESERPVHRVTVEKGFYMGVCLVTQAQWHAVMGNDPSHFKGPNLPVETVSWHDCQEFCTKLTLRLSDDGVVELPTEPEWEYACRAGTTTHFHFGDVINTDLVNYDGMYRWNGSPAGASRRATTEVAALPANGWGLCDVHGNVWEWCADLCGPYPPGPQPHEWVWASSDDPNLRGGCWGNNPSVCRSADRYRSAPSRRSEQIGFRVCVRPE